MTSTPGSSEEEARAITRLVDGSLGERERPALEAWAATHPAVSRQVAKQRRVARALRVGGPSAPQSLITALEASVTSRRRPHSPPATRTWRPTARMPALAAVAAGALATGILVVPLSQPTDHGRPSIALAAKLAFAPASEPAPASKTSTLLDVVYGGITFPNYAARFGAVPTGERVDHLAGRPALTVFYRLRGGARLSYTVYSGTPIPLPRVTRTVTFEGVPMHLAQVDPHLAVVTLVRHGHTCVLAAPTAAGAVLALAEAPLRTQSA
jgi:hypothetical protein